MSIIEIHVGDRVRFLGDESSSYEVTYVGRKYFHVALEDGRITGPYGPELVTEVITA